MARLGLTAALVHLRVGEGQLEEAQRRLYRRFAMPQVRLHLLWLLRVHSKLSYPFKVRPGHPDRRDCALLLIAPMAKSLQILTDVIQMQALHDVVQAGYARYIGMSSCYAWQCTALSPTLFPTHSLTHTTVYAMQS